MEIDKAGVKFNEFYPYVKLLGGRNKDLRQDLAVSLWRKLLNVNELPDSGIYKFIGREHWKIKKYESRKRTLKVRLEWEMQHNSQVVEQVLGKSIISTYLKNKEVVLSPSILEKISMTGRTPRTELIEREFKKSLFNEIDKVYKGYPQKIEVIKVLVEIMRLYGRRPKAMWPFFKGRISRVTYWKYINVVTEITSKLLKGEE